MGIFGMYSNMQTSIEKMADVFDSMDIGGDATFSTFTCDEMEVIADVLRSAGRDETADRIIEWHAAGDDIGDDHYKGPIIEEAL